MNEPKIDVVGMLDIPGNECIRRVYGAEGIAPTLSTMQGGGRQPMVLLPFNTEPDGTSRTIKAQYAKTSAANFERSGTYGATGVIEMIVTEKLTTRGQDVCSTIRATIHKQGARNIEENVRSGLGYEGVVEVTRCPLKFLDRNQKNVEGDYAFTVDTCHTGGVKEVYEDKNVRIRKLTPKECWRLMGFDDEDFAKAEAVCSNSQLYKQAGNSIVVPVLEYLLGELDLEEMKK